MKYCLILGNRFEEIEAITIVDLLRRAGIIVETYGVGSKLIHGGQKIGIEADKIFNKESDIDINAYSGLLLPGGPGTRELAQNTEIIRLVQQFDLKKKLIFAICAAPLILDRAGILRNKNYTCYPGTEKEIPNAKKQSQTVVRDGNIITAEGIGCAIEGGLFLVETILSKNEAVLLSEKVVYRAGR